MARNQSCRHTVDSVHSSLILWAFRGLIVFDSRLALFLCPAKTVENTVFAIFSAPIAAGIQKNERFLKGMSDL